MNSFDQQYIRILTEIREQGVTKGDRTGTGTTSRFGMQARFSLKDGRIPVTSLRKIYTRSFIHETLWFLSGSTDIGYLKDNSVSIWDSWVKPGTERYRDMTDEELRGAVRKELFVNPGQISRPFDDIEFLSPSSEGESAEEVVQRYREMDDGQIRLSLVYDHHDKLRAFYRQVMANKIKYAIKEDQLADGWEDVKFIKTEASAPDRHWWAMEATIGTRVREVLYTDDSQLIDLLKELTGERIDIEPRILAGGSIGIGAYGAQWRRWDDTRLVDEAQARIPAVKERGFTVVGNVGSRTVITREVDQIADIVHALRTNPDSRRILLVAYNPAMVADAVLPACHSFVQFWTRELSLDERAALLSPDRQQEYQAYRQQVDESPRLLKAWLGCEGAPRRALSCHLYMRSNDAVLGGQSNIPQYGLLTHMLAQVTGMVAEEFIWTGGDTHIYQNQNDGVDEYLTRTGHAEEARVRLNPAIKEIDDFTFDDIEIHNYSHDGSIKFPVAV